MIKNSLILILNLFFISNAIAIGNDSIKINPPRSHAVGVGLTIGSEIGPNLRYEMEKQDWGKIIVNGQMLVYTPISDNILFDLGLGYGYPISVSDKNAIYLNGIFSSGVHVTIKHGYTSYCSSGILEFEYRRNIGDFSINLLPFSRLMYTYGKYKSGYTLTFSYGLKVGVMYRF